MQERGLRIDRTRSRLEADISAVGGNFSGRWNLRDASRVKEAIFYLPPAYKFGGERTMRAGEIRSGSSTTGVTVRAVGSSEGTKGMVP